MYLCVWKCTLSAESFNTSRQSISRRAILGLCLLLKDALHRVVRAKSREVNKTKPIVPSFVFFLFSFFVFCLQHLVLRVWVRVIFSGLSFWCSQMNNCWQFSGSVQLYIDSFCCFSFFLQGWWQTRLRIRGWGYRNDSRDRRNKGRGKPVARKLLLCIFCTPRSSKALTDPVKDYTFTPPSPLHHHVFPP